jgi:VWFA-related protein
MRVCSSTILPICVILSSFIASAQIPQPQPNPDSVPTLHVTAREVIFDVMVTGKDGQPVRGLQQSDFSITENGRPQIVRSFAEFSSTVPPVQPPSLKLPPNVYTNSHAVPATGPVNIFLFDAMNSGILITHARQQVVDYLKVMPEGTSVAIFWLSETGLHMLQPFTSDRSLLIKATSAPRTDFGAAGNRWSRQMTTIHALNQIAAYVSGIKGRKNLFWFTPGLPLLIMRDGGLSWGLDPASRDMSLVHHLMDTYDILTAAQVAVYPADLLGVHGLDLESLEVEKVAEDFGSEAIYNTNDLTTAVAKAIDNGSSFYTLSYIPPKQTDDGHYHTIKVELDKPGLHLVYRKGYNAERVPVDEPTSGPPMMKASMEGNAPPATQILFQVKVSPDTQGTTSSATSLPPDKRKSDPPKKGPPKLVPYVIHYGFPASEIAFLEQLDGSLHGALEFDVVAFDNRRTRVALLTQTLNMPMNLDRYDDFAAKPFNFTQQVDLPPGSLSLHVGIYDTVSHKVGTLEIPLTVR